MKKLINFFIPDDEKYKRRLRLYAMSYLITGIVFLMSAIPMQYFVSHRIKTFETYNTKLITKLTDIKNTLNDTDSTLLNIAIEDIFKRTGDLKFSGELIVFFTVAIAINYILFTSFIFRSNRIIKELEKRDEEH